VPKSGDRCIRIAGENARGRLVALVVAFGYVSRCQENDALARCGRARTVAENRADSEGRADDEDGHGGSDDDLEAHPLEASILVGRPTHSAQAPCPLVAPRSCGPDSYAFFRDLRSDAKVRAATRSYVSKATVHSSE